MPTELLLAVLNLTALVILITVLLVRTGKFVSDLKNEIVKGVQSDMNVQINQVKESVKDSLTQFELRIRSLEQNSELKLNSMRNTLNDNITALQGENQKQLEKINDTVSYKFQSALNQRILEFTNGVHDNLERQVTQFEKSVANAITQMENRIHSLEDTNIAQAKIIKGDISDTLTLLRNENREQLEQIRKTVDEHLQTTLEKRISESFKSVSERLEQVQFGLGEMKNLANDVGGLKQVLSGVKTRGIFGEIQLESILQDILTPEQYEKNIATVPKSNFRVEFAVKLPNPNGEGFTYIPIDSKFHLDVYHSLRNAVEISDKKLIEEARSNLRKAVLVSAKDIKEKYIYPPATVNFAIMFLPLEGLYIEAVNNGLLEEVRKKYGVNIVGPSTMAAFLSSLRMGFQMLAIQKRSDEVWQILSSVKTEFLKFEDIMEKMKTHLTATSNDLDKMIGVRTRAIRRRLENIETLESKIEN